MIRLNDWRNWLSKLGNPRSISRKQLHEGVVDFYAINDDAFEDELQKIYDSRHPFHENNSIYARGYEQMNSQAKADEWRRIFLGKEETEAKLINIKTMIFEEKCSALLHLARHHRPDVLAMRKLGKEFQKSDPDHALELQSFLEELIKKVMA